MSPCAYDQSTPNLFTGSLRARKSLLENTCRESTSARCASSVVLRRLLLVKLEIRASLTRRLLRKSFRNLREEIIDARVVLRTDFEVANADLSCILFRLFAPYLSRLQVNLISNEREHDICRRLFIQFSHPVHGQEMPVMRLRHFTTDLSSNCQFVIGNCIT